MSLPSLFEVKEWDCTYFRTSPHLFQVRSRVNIGKSALIAGSYQDLEFFLHVQLAWGTLVLQGRVGSLDTPYLS
mgnify:CR=1 FL=1